MDKFSLLIELLVINMNTSVEDNTRLVDLLVDRDNLLPVENRDRVLPLERDHLLLEDYNNHNLA